MRLFLLLVGAGTLLSAADASADLYSTKVAPILADRCYECHGPKKAKHSLRLDSLEAILKGGKELGHAVIPGKPDDSPLIKLVILGKGEEQSMPPKGDRLKPEEIAILKQWIAEGAKGPAAPAK